MYTQCMYVCVCVCTYACTYVPYLCVCVCVFDKCFLVSSFNFFVWLDLQCRPLKEVHLVKNRAGKSKGFAYVEYLSEVKLIFIFIFKSRIEPTIDL